MAQCPVTVTAGADDVDFTYDRFMTDRAIRITVLDSVDRVEVVDRYTVKFLPKEPLSARQYAACRRGGHCRRVVQQFGDLKKSRRHWHGLLLSIAEREDHVSASSAFRGQPCGGVEWLVLDDESTGLAMYRTGQIDCGPGLNWVVRQQDLEALKKSHPQLVYRDFLSQTTHAIMMRTDMAPFTDVRVRRAISHAIDRQALIEAVWGQGAPTAAVSRGLVEWSLPVDQLGEGAKYYQYDPKEARRLLAEAGFPKGFKTQLAASTGYGRDLVDDVQLVQRFLKDVGIETELKLQEFGAYQATTVQGKFEGLVRGPFGIAWEPDSPLYRAYASDSSWNTGHVNDPKLTAMLKEQRRKI
jgi:ABC-type transport system substrate-binding protein